MVRTLLLLAIVVSAYAIEITGISTKTTPTNESTKKGSLVGGTRLYFRGKLDGYNAEDFTVTVGELPCPIREFYQADDYFECVTPNPGSMQDQEVPIQISHS